MKKYFVSEVKTVKIFKLREISKETGCLVVVRPDQHIANILPLKAFNEISEFFDKFMTKR